MKRGLVLVLGLAFLTLIGVAAGVLLRPAPEVGVSATETRGKALIGGPFTLTDHNGMRVTDGDFRGEHMLVFFGFTHCPDVCPTALQTVSEAMDLLGDRADAVRPIFITVDPERDTPTHLASYLAHFHPRLLGLTGSPEEIDAAAKAYRVYHRKVSLDEDSGGDAYTVDHSAFIYLMGPDGEYLTHFGPAAGAEEMAEGIRKHLQDGGDVA
jgi:cytochrome oxidase Cu insertion factor (SCO1/SenC/PrrC family)